MRAVASLHVPRVPRMIWPGGVRAFWATTTGIGVLAVWMGVLYAPVDDAMGIVQKLVYLHIPAAVGAMSAAVASFAASLAYVWSRARVWDRVALESARVVVFCTLIVLGTGMVWGKSEWGVWWTWSPKLTFTLVLCLLYAVMVLLHSCVHPASRRAMICAVYGAIAFLDVPLVYLSVRLLPDVHPTSLPLTSEMRATLAVWLLLVLMAGAGVVAAPIVRWRRRLEELGRIRGVR